jgi:hypothetical protein
MSTSTCLSGGSATIACCYHPSQRPYIGFKAPDGKAYVYDGSAIGVGSACACFSAVSTYVVWLCKQRGLPDGVAIIPFVDDFTLLARSGADLLAAIAVLERVCRDINLTIDPADPKNTQPARQLVALGLLFDSEAMSVGLPDDKLVRRAADVFVLELCAQAGVEVPVGYFRSVAGKIAHLASVYPAVAVHTRGLCLPLAMVDAAGKPLRFLRLWGSDTRLVKARAAIDWMAEAFRSGRLSAPRLLARGPSPVVSISADASGDVGWGCQWGGDAYWGR